MIIDTHAHLFIGDIKNDIDSVLKRAEDEGIEAIIIPATNSKDSEEVIELCNKHEMLYAAIGLHPTEIINSDENDLLRIEELCSNEKVKAIGEIGLDYYWKPFDAEKEKHFLREQIKLAKKKNLPVIIHNRESTEDLLELIKKEYAEGKFRGQFHSFSGNMNMAEECINMGFYISFTGNLTYKPNQNTLAAYEIVKYSPVENLLLETDTPYLPPVPYRGKRNEPSYIKYTAKKISELKDMDYNELCMKTTQNARNLFKLSK